MQLRSLSSDWLIKLTSRSLVWGQTDDFQCLAVVSLKCTHALAYSCILCLGSGAFRSFCNLMCMCSHVSSFRLFFQVHLRCLLHALLHSGSAQLRLYRWHGRHYNASLTPFRNVKHIAGPRTYTQHCVVRASHLVRTHEYHEVNEKDSFELKYDRPPKENGCRPGYVGMFRGKNEQHGLEVEQKGSHFWNHRGLSLDVLPRLLSSEKVPRSSEEGVLVFVTCLTRAPWNPDKWPLGDPCTSDL